MTRTVLLDNEAVQALLSVHHPKHRRVLAHLQVVATRRLRQLAIDVEVPTAVRVEAGWDRSRPSAALINRLRIADAPLDGPQANVAASIRGDLGVSVADSHLGATMRLRATAGGGVTVLTSDRADVTRLASRVDRRIVVVQI